MSNQDLRSKDPLKLKDPSGATIDYSPKTYTLAENLMGLVKMFAIAAAFLIALWISRRYLL